MLCWGDELWGEWLGCRVEGCYLRSGLDNYVVIALVYGVGVEGRVLLPQIGSRQSREISVNRCRANMARNDSQGQIQDLSCRQTSLGQILA
jgi:hypothetical protein